jgi:hypothetical protein
LKVTAWAAIVHVMAESDPSAASLLALQLPAGSGRTHVCAETAAAWSRTDPAAALAWAETLSPDERRLAQSSCISTIAATNPVTAAAAVLQKGADSELPHRMAALMGVWARNDAAGAAQWAEKLPVNSPAQSIAMQQLVYHWTDIEPEQASEWLQKQAEGSARDEAAASLSIRVTASDPEAAAVWASSINNPERRAAELRRTLLAWLKTDNPSAQHWMEAEGLAGIPGLSQ